jgi:hypothetical protein
MVRGQAFIRWPYPVSSEPGIGWVDLTFDADSTRDHYPMASLDPGLCSYIKLGLYRNAAIVPAASSMTVTCPSCSRRRRPAASPAA